MNKIKTKSNLKIKKNKKKQKIIMLNAQEFLNEMFKIHPSLKNYYLYQMTESIDKIFIIDLKKVNLSLLEPKIVNSEITNFLMFIENSEKKQTSKNLKNIENTQNLKSMFFNYLRYNKNNYFIRQRVWDFLYSLEILKLNFEEIFVFLNILNFSIKNVDILRTYFLWKKIIGEFGDDDFVFLDEVFLKFEDLKKILKKIFGEKGILKIRLFKDLKVVKGSSVMSLLIRDYIANEKNIKKQRKKKIKKENQKNNKKPLSKKEEFLIKIIEKNNLKERSKKEKEQNIKRREKNSSNLKRENEKNLKTTQKTNSPKKNNSLKKKNSSISFTKNSKKTIKRQKSEIIIKKYNIKSLLEKTKKQKNYLNESKNELNEKISRIDNLNKDMDIEYEYLYDRGFKIYEIYLDVCYNLKKYCNENFVKFPLSEENVRKIQEFSKFEDLHLKVKK